jgi:hypothetical protein
MAEVLCSKPRAVHYYVKVVFQVLQISHSFLYYLATCLFKSEKQNISELMPTFSVGGIQWRSGCGSHGTNS